MIAKRILVGYFLLICTMAGIWYMYGYFTVLYFLFSLIIYGLIAFILHRIYSIIRKRKHKPLQEFLITFIYKASIFTSLIIVLTWYFIYHQTHLFPTKLPSYTITNGEKTIVFQTMSHIGSQQFYVGVQERLLKAKQSGYVLFFEGVQPGNAENKKKFDQALGVNLNPESYEQLAYLYGLSSQDNQMFLGLENDKDYNIDMSIDDIVRIYERKYTASTTNTSSGANMQEVFNIEEQLLSQLDNLSKKELFLIRYFNQAIINFIMKHDALRNGILSLTGRDDIFSVILDDRNKFLVQGITESKEKKIYILYGLMHFQGVFELLQQQDSRWRIVTAEYSRVIYPVENQE